MIRKIFLILLVALFYYWITQSHSNALIVKSFYQAVSEKLKKMELHLNFPEKNKKRKW